MHAFPASQTKSCEFKGLRNQVVRCGDPRQEPGMRWNLQIISDLLGFYSRRCRPGRDSLNSHVGPQHLGYHN